MSKNVKLTLTEEEAVFLSTVLKNHSINSKNKANRLTAISKYESGAVLNNEQQKIFKNSQRQSKAVAGILFVLSNISDRINENLTFEMVKNKIKIKK